MNDGLDSISLRNDSYNIIHNKMHYYDTPKLDVNDAINCFSLWYERGNFYDYTIEPDDKKKGKFIILYVIFMILLLEILVN